MATAEAAAGKFQHAPEKARSDAGFFISPLTQYSYPIHTLAENALCVPHNARMQTLFRTVGYGIILYAVMYLAWGLFAAYGFAGTQIARLGLFLVLIASTAIAARSLRYSSLRDSMLFVIAWLATIAVLDALFAGANGTWSIFADPNLWIGYLLVLGTPIVFHIPAAHAPIART